MSNNLDGDFGSFIDERITRKVWTPEYEKCLHSCVEKEKAFREKISGALYDEFRELSNALSELDAITADMHYRVGFADGIKFSESLPNSRCAAEEDKPLIPSRAMAERLTDLMDISRIYRDIISIMQSMTNDEVYTVEHVFHGLQGIAEGLHELMSDLSLDEDDTVIQRTTRNGGALVG